MSYWRFSKGDASHRGDGPCAACRSRTVVAQHLKPGFAGVRIERSIGLATGHDADLSALRRFLEYQLARFLIQRKLTGRWGVLAYVSREEVKP